MEDDAGRGDDAMSESQASFFGVTEEEKEAADVGDRRRNTLATPEFLLSIVSCCCCGGPLPAGRRYVCDACQHPKTETAR